MKARHYLEYALVRVFRALLLLMPRRAAAWCGRRLGELFFLLDRRHRKEVLANLELAFGQEKTKKEKLQIARGAYRHFGGILFEFLRSPTPTLKQVERTTEVQGWENLESAYAMGKGVLILTAHYGFWELMGVVQGLRGRPLNVVARRLDNPLLVRLLRRFRSSSGNTVFYKQNAVKATLGALRKNEAVAVLIDQNISPEQGIFVDFFGVPASTTPILSAIALKTGAPIIPAFSQPLPGGRWRFLYDPPLEINTNGNRTEAIRRITQQCTRVIERYIRKRPDIWLWMHRRWKAQPPVEKQDGR